jgi:hypothetical protein
MQEINSIAAGQLRLTLVRNVGKAMWQTTMAQSVRLDISSTGDATYRRDVVSFPFEIEGGGSPS